MVDLPALDDLYHLIQLEVVDSTNEEASRLAREGAQSGTLIWAHSQTKGRGRRGRNWISLAGNLYFSLVLRPNVHVTQATQINFVAPLALFNALVFILPEQARVHNKWPNDVLVGGKKIAGILIESSTQGETLEWLVLGVGVNVGSSPDNVSFPATSLAKSGAPHVSPAHVLERFAESFKRWMEHWTDEGFAPVRKKWLECAWRLGEEIKVNLEQETLCGRFIGIDDNGALILELAGGERRMITAGDVVVGFSR